MILNEIVQKSITQKLVKQKYDLAQAAVCSFEFYRPTPSLTAQPTPSFKKQQLPPRNIKPKPLLPKKPPEPAIKIVKPARTNDPFKFHNQLYTFDKLKSLTWLNT